MKDLERYIDEVATDNDTAAWMIKQKTDAMKQVIDTLLQARVLKDGYRLTWELDTLNRAYQMAIQVAEVELPS